MTLFILFRGALQFLPFLLKKGARFATPAMRKAK